MRKPLEGIRVVELGDYVLAPVTCRFLADMGAAVIKVEKSTGNIWRIFSLDYNRERFSDDENPGYDIFNTGKKHIALNLKTPTGMELFHRLLSTADVFVTNNRVQALKRLHLDFDSIKDRYPRLIYALGLGYGENGPFANAPAFDHTAFWARTGLLLDTAPVQESYRPTYPPSSMGDIFSGMTLASEICAAIYNRTITGKGDYVRTSLFHNGVFAASSMQVMTEESCGNVFPRSRASMGICAGDFRCRDGGYLFVAAGYAEKFLSAVCSAIGWENLLQDERFSTAEARKENCEALYQTLQEAFLTKDCDEWIELFDRMDVPVGKMQHFADLPADEQARANGYIQDVVYQSGRVFPLASSPIEMDSVGTVKTVPSPLIGADTAEVLSEIGLSAEKISELRQKGIIC